MGRLPHSTAVDRATPASWDGSDPLPGDPLAVAATWLAEAFATRAQPNPHAVALATIEPDGRPSARMVLCQGIDRASGELVFYTDRSSHKGRALAADPRAAMVFYFSERSRQVRVEGAVRPTADTDGDTYFAGRPRESQIGAWASEQSHAVASRDELHARREAARNRFEADGVVARPARWGGYALRAERVELWIAGPARIHDRAHYERARGDDAWHGTRLQP